MATTMRLTRALKSAFGQVPHTRCTRNFPSTSLLVENTRCFSAPAPVEDTSSKEENVTLSSAKLQKMFDQIKELPEKEVNILGSLVLQVLGKKVFPGEFGGPVGPAAGQDASAEEVVEEKKIAFDIKLVGFDTKAKIKVIKEVRALSGLGLKEAKDLVEGAPKIIQKGLKEDKAEELKAQLEAIGAEIEIV